MSEKLYKTTEIAELLNISVSTVKKWVKQGKLHALRVGRLWMVPESEVMRILSSIEKGEVRAVIHARVSSRKQKASDRLEQQVEEPEFKSENAGNSVSVSSYLESFDPPRTPITRLLRGVYRYPITRPRRLRRTQGIRDLVAQTRLSIEALVQPVFVDERISGERVAIESMPDQYRYSVEGIVKFVGELLEAGIKSILVFGVPSEKDPMAKRAYDSEGPVQRALKSIRREYGDEVLIATDVCVCSYTDHGHCGIVVKKGSGYVVDNDESIKILSKIAVSHAEAGADIVAPSAMMDGQVSAIREALDSEGFSDIAIMSYSAKYASSLYGPFRLAASSEPQFGDRRGYQMDPRNAWEALKEVEMDIEEGADIVMVKPGLWYLDIVRLIKDNFPEVPLAVYSVSGEYLMIKAAAMRGYISESQAILEALTAIKRAGADIIITYYAYKIPELLRR